MFTNEKFWDNELNDKKIFFFINITFTDYFFIHHILLKIEYFRIRSKIKLIYILKRK